MTAAAGAALWRWLLAPATLPALPPPPAALAGAERLSRLLSAPLAAYLLEPLARALGRPVVDPVAVERGRLRARFVRHRQAEALARLAAVAVPVVSLKGFAAAHTLYPDPAVRVVGDLDLLVRRADRDPALAALCAAGFAFRTPGRGRLTLASTASYDPLVAADGGCEVDLHLEPDADPLPRGLDAGAVFDAARTVVWNGAAIAVPAPAHALLIAVSNIAKDKYGPFAARKLVDLARILDRYGGALDWTEIRARAARARLERPLSASLALLGALGWTGTVPAGIACPPGGGRGEFARVVRAWHALALDQPGPWTMLRREWRLGPGWPVPVVHAGRRVAGLVRPPAGVPRGWEAPRGPAPSPPERPDPGRAGHGRPG